MVAVASPATAGAQSLAAGSWPRDRLHAIQQPYPHNRDSDDVAQAGCSSTAEHRAFLAAEVDRVLAATAAPQRVLFGNSRGGYAIRSVVTHGGAAKVSHAILAGTPVHGIFHDAASNPAGEFNGAGPFLQSLNNQGARDVEITPGPRWLSLRSDNNDMVAQPDDTWFGAPGKPTGVGAYSPELRGAKNIVLSGADHSETAFSAQAFAAAFAFITGRAPARTGFTPEAQVVLDGQPIAARLWPAADNHLVLLELH